MKRMLWLLALPVLLGCCCPMPVDAASERETAPSAKELDRIESDYSQMKSDKAKAQQVFGIDPNAEYPYWPLAYAGDKFVQEAYSANMSGYVMNCSDKRTGLVSVRFDVYDKSGNKVGTANDFIDSIGPWESWKFKASYFGSDASSYKGPYIQN